MKRHCTWTNERYTVATEAQKKTGTNMKAIPKTFKAFRIHNDTEGYRSGIEKISIDDLSDGDVVIRAEWSGINYKDALAATGKGKILKSYPLAGGIDVAGSVVASSCKRFSSGDKVLVTGCGLSEKRDGGYSQYLKLDSNSVIPLPPDSPLARPWVLERLDLLRQYPCIAWKHLDRHPKPGPSWSPAPVAVLEVLQLTS